MAVTVRKLMEGQNAVVLHVFLESEGAELDNFVLISPADLVPPRPSTAPALRIKRLYYQFIWFDAVLKYGGVTPRQILALARDTSGKMNFEHFGGVADTPTAPPSDQNGKLLISTNDFAPAGSQGHLILEMVKV